MSIGEYGLDFLMTMTMLIMMMIMTMIIMLIMMLIMTMKMSVHLFLADSLSSSRSAPLGGFSSFPEPSLINIKIKIKSPA